MMMMRMMMTMMVIAITVQRCSFGLYSNSSESLYNPASKRRILVRASLDCDGDHSLAASPARKNLFDFILIYWDWYGFIRVLVSLLVSMIDIGRDCLLTGWLVCLFACLIDCLIIVLFFCLQLLKKRFSVNKVSVVYLIIICSYYSLLDTVQNLWVRRFIVVIYTRDS